MPDSKKSIFSAEHSTGCAAVEGFHSGWPRIGLIADTHALLRPEACALLAGCSMILHAGDIGSSRVLTELRDIAPVVAVRGNVDKGSWAQAIPDKAVAEIRGIRILLIHNLKDLSEDPRAAGYQVVVFGHSHRPSISIRDEIIFVNPGSAGPRRFELPVSLALLIIADGGPVASLHRLPIDRSARLLRPY